MQLTTFKENFEVYDGEKLWFKSDNIDEVKSVIENTFKDASIIYEEYEEAREVEYIDSKDFVRTKIAEVRTEIAGVKSDYRSLRQEMKFYAIGLGILIVILQPKVFDFITAFLK
ncbi:hypothetical protein [Helicobacter apodemus]|uniref:Uncharacterized protein n=1 Tax=Helicobacter apodemus TaxID=135569 RepID=A0A2U8FD79_9HELI|nr:hypothetical protein [Helicobacter apodemus]AWI34169.1 hypothetical protein CDV25_04865 [Helicobacter apodemus]